ncbi:MAG: ABC transporter substrate-binding protein, partial [Psychromonas sp.]
MRLSLCIILALMLTGCYKNESSKTDTLLYCLENSPKSFNPQISQDIATLDVTTHQLYNRLVKIDPTTNHFIADLAEDWVISEDNTQYTFSLKKDVPFHDTEYFTPSRNLNASDVIFSFQRILKQSHPFHSINNNLDVDFINHPFASLIDNIVKIDDYTVQINLNKPDATLLSNLAAPY